MRQGRLFRNVIVVGVLAALCLTISYGLVYLSDTMVRPPLAALENQIIDLAFQIRDKNQFHTTVTPEDVVIIDIDDASIRELGRTALWPRAYDARIIDHIASGRPAAIGIDYLYTEPDSLPAEYKWMLREKGHPNAHSIISDLSTDPVLARSISNAGVVYLSFFDDDAHLATPVGDTTLSSLRHFCDEPDENNQYPLLRYPVLPIHEFCAGAKGVGAISMPTMQDGTVRNYQVIQRLRVTQSDKGNSCFTSNFPVFMVADRQGVRDEDIRFVPEGLALTEDMVIPLRTDGTFRINWLGKSEGFRYIPFYKVLDQRVPAEYFENKYVFFGTSASGLQDLKTVPCRQDKMPGVEVHAVAFLNMINASYITEISSKEAMPFFALISLLLVALFFLIRPLFGFITASALVFAEVFVFVLKVLPEYNTVFPLVTLILLTFLSYLASSLYIYFIRERKSRRLKNAFSSYVSPEVVEQISRDSATTKLGGEKKELTVLFSDIRGFTGFSEQLDPEQIVAFLNDYLSRMSECIFKHKGTIDKFIGDAIMAIFGAPVPQPDHADRACHVALDMMEEVRRINQEQAERGEAPLHIGIGINTGEMTVGNIGSRRRFDYTVIGDAVNLGSRLEGLSKFFGVDIIVSDATRQQCKDAQLVFRELGQVRPKGKDVPVTIFELRRNSADAAEMDYLRLWNEAYSAFKRGDVSGASDRFASMNASYPGDLSVQFYHRQTRYFVAHPEEFTPVVTMESK